MAPSVCSSCSQEYEGRNWLLARRWCKSCRAYVCNNCMETKRICPKCGTKTGFDFIYLLALGVVIIIIGLFLLGMYYSIYSEQIQGNNLPVTAISEVQKGSTVKISGIIVATEKVVIEKKSTASGRAVGEYWELDNFKVNDTSHEILVDVTELKNQENLNRIEYGAHNDGYEYWAGDEIAVIGTVDEDASGNTIVKAKYIATGPWQFGQSSPPWFARR